jgi:hypothetical protein
MSRIPARAPRVLQAVRTAVRTMTDRGDAARPQGL